MTADQRFRPHDRIRKRAEFQIVYQGGRRVTSRSFVLFVLPNAQRRPRLGITVTTKIGNAVRRNRAKRLLREIFRRHKSELMDVDIVVNGRSVLPRADYRRLETEWLECLRPWCKAS